MWLIRRQNCFSDGNEKESIITDKSINKDSFLEVWRSGKGWNHSSTLPPSSFPMGWKQSSSLAASAKTEQKRTPGGWIPTLPHARKVPSHSDEVSAPSVPLVLISLLKAELNLKRSTGESSCLMGGKTFAGRSFQKSLPAASTCRCCA